MYKIEYYIDGHIKNEFSDGSYMKVMFMFAGLFKQAAIDVFLATGAVYKEVNVVLYDTDGSIKEEANFTHKQL